MQDCCRQGFRWQGQPTGTTQKINDVDVYVAGDKPDAAILLLHDAFGWSWPNNRLLADHFAKEAGATVYLPDFFHGTEVKEADLPSDPSKADWTPFLTANNWDIRRPEYVSFARHIRAKHTKVGAVGYCWGGKAAIELAGSKHLEQQPVLDAVSIAHPGGLTKDDFSDLKLPIQIIAPEHDPPFDPELRKFAIEEIGRLGLDLDYQYFPGLAHGFATRCNLENAGERRALERAKNAVVSWFQNYLK